MFETNLSEKIKDVGSPLCLGVDPHIDEVPGKFLSKKLEGMGPIAFLEKFCLSLIDACADEVCAVKFQSACFEKFGGAAWDLQKKLIAHARSKGLLTILDVKRGDISSTMEAYGQACFGNMGADAMTVLPYMGIGVLKPLLPWMKRGKGVYIVWVSSNEDGYNLQSKVALDVIRELKAWQGGNKVTGSCGLVLGATKLSNLPPDWLEEALGFPLLLPGVGAQGATLSPGMVSELLDRAPASLFPVSRAISGLGLPQAKGAMGSLGSWTELSDFFTDNLEKVQNLLDL